MGTYDFNWFHINSRVTGHHAFTNWSSSGDLESCQSCTFGSKPTPPRFQRIGGWIGRMLEIRHMSLSKLRCWELELQMEVFWTGSFTSEIWIHDFEIWNQILQLLNPLRTPSHIQLCLATGLAGKTGTVATLSSFCLIWDPKTKIGRQNDGKTARTMPRKWVRV